MVNKRPMPDPGEQLTERELSIAYLVAEGLMNDQIGAKLFISGFTVKTHLARIAVKTGAANRAHLAAIISSEGRCRTAPGIIRMMEERKIRLTEYRPDPGTRESFFREAQLYLLGQLIEQIAQLREPLS